MIIRWRKQQDFFIVRLYQDLVGDWVLSESWGNSLNQDNAFNHTVYHCYHEARHRLREIGREKKQLGFKKTAAKEQQIELDFG
ncbi:hypothetical protein [Aliamphritea hakodatensis]|uniref:hypothetical protein n=1 Tax=Aliamphritea hakodatensis TaxID=2895352 RepID=UPI0022FD4BED|nr:hypothetical protein [Aliamphritea hakodatensis]